MKLGRAAAIRWILVNIEPWFVWSGIQQVELAVLIVIHKERHSITLLPQAKRKVLVGWTEFM